MLVTPIGQQRDAEGSATVSLRIGEVRADPELWAVLPVMGFWTNWMRRTDRKF